MEAHVNNNNYPTIKPELVRIPRDGYVGMSSCMYAQPFPIANVTSNNVSKAKLFRFHYMKDNSQLSHCRRRLDFSQLDENGYYGLKQGPHVSVARRNERERNRVKLINMTFATLREHLPQTPDCSKSKKMSKVDTLKATIDYIRYLQTIVDDGESVSAVFDGDCHIDPCVPFNIPATSTNPLTSPTTSNEISDCSYDGLSAEEEELLDFASWF